jgi:hypothetical protein
LRQAGVDPQARPEAVPVEQFVALANLLPHARPEAGAAQQRGCCTLLQPRRHP